MVEETFDTRAQGQAAWTSAETRAAMEADGIDMSSVWVDYFDEVGSAGARPRIAGGDGHRRRRQYSAEREATGSAAVVTVSLLEPAAPAGLVTF